jgi:hypothetical protein
MTTETTTTTHAPTRRSNGGDTAHALSTMQGAVHEVRGALAGVGRSVPHVARVSRSAIGDVYALIESGSDERVSAGVTLSLGLAIGLLIGGAPRLVIAIALAPLAAMGFVLADRRATAARASRASS